MRYQTFNRHQPGPAAGAIPLFYFTMAEIYLMLEGIIPGNKIFLYI